MPTILLGSSGASSRTSGSAHRSPVSSIGAERVLGDGRDGQRLDRRAGLPLHLAEADLAGGGRETGDTHGLDPTRGAGADLRDGILRVVTADRARRRAVLMLSALAGAMLLAGVLPWVTGGESTIRFLALPLLLAGLMVLGVTLRVWAAGRRPAPLGPAGRARLRRLRLRPAGRLRGRRPAGRRAGRCVGPRAGRPGSGGRSCTGRSHARRLTTIAARRNLRRPAIAAPDRRRAGVRRWLLPAYPVLLVLLTLVQVVAPRRSGPLALTEVFAPWLFLPLLVLLPFAWALRDRVLVVALALAAVTFAVHLGPALVPAPHPQPPAGAVPVRVASWNIYIRNPAARVVDTVRSLDADVVGLVEVNPRQAARLDADPALRARYRTVLMVPEANRGLLSRYPADRLRRARGSRRGGPDPACCGLGSTSAAAGGSRSSWRTRCRQRLHRPRRCRCTGTPGPATPRSRT